MSTRGCIHPADMRKKLRGAAGRVKCGKCGKEFIPRNVTTKHGTYLGYCRHYKLRKGQWKWPADGGCGCNEAAQRWRAEYQNRPEAIESRRVRGSARAEALARLRRAYPAAYRAIYTEELERRGERNVRQGRDMPDWEDVVARLVKAATGRDESDMDARIRNGWATGGEREFMSQLRRIRVLLARRSDIGRD